ncbi:MAG: hypothetical protein EOP39_14975 [Rubrivivax sp.]|nr:MAG: hypothetical protein EOP39_14975 [Rubrivivax sp.]
MRRFFAVFVVLLGLAFAAQAMASATAGYSDCCLQGCKGVSHCASAACQACAAPQPAPAQDILRAKAPPDPPRWQPAPEPFIESQAAAPWRPPD